MKVRALALFASGSGSNAECIIRHLSGQNLVETAIVYTENPNAYVLERAKKLGIAAHILPPSMVRGEGFLNLLVSQKVDFIVLAGFLKLVPNEVVEQYKGRIVNIHPALLPKYGGRGMYGMRVHELVVRNQERESGITIHYVNRNYDEGAVIFQEKCPLSPHDTPETLAQRVQKLEHTHYPRVIEKLLSQL